MNLYRIFQTKNNNRDTFDSAVVCAASIEDARRINPDRLHKRGYPNYHWTDEDHVSVQLIGIADDTIPEGSVICASFNAG